MTISAGRPVALVTGSTSGIGEGIAGRRAGGGPRGHDVRADLSYDVRAERLVAPWIVTTATVPSLRTSAEAGGPGAIVNITSHAGVRPKNASIPYAATKAASGHVTRLLAAALGPAVRVNAIAPGLVDAPLSADWTDVQEHWRTTAPMRRRPTGGRRRPGRLADREPLHHR